MEHGGVSKALKKLIRDDFQHLQNTRKQTRTDRKPEKTEKAPKKALFFNSV